MDGHVLRRPLRVLIADDAPPMRDLLRVLLPTSAGVEIVGEAENGVEVLAFLRSAVQVPDLVLLDVNMPVVDGPAAAEIIVTYYPGIEVVLHTGSPQSEAATRAHRMGLPVLDKLGFEALIERLRATPGSPAVLGAGVDDLVLTALALAWGEEPKVLVLPDGMVPFYNHAAATLLSLPFPATGESLARLAAGIDVTDLRGRPIPPEERPASVALRERRPVEDEEDVVAHANGKDFRCRIRALPLFDERGTFLGVVSKLSVSQPPADAVRARAGELREQAAALHAQARQIARRHNLRPGRPDGPAARTRS